MKKLGIINHLRAISTSQPLECIQGQATIYRQTVIAQIVVCPRLFSRENMPRKRPYSALLILIMFFVSAPLFSWLYVKFYLSRNAMPYSTTWSDTQACYINSYIPNYWSLGVLGITVELFSSDAFFRVYRKDGTLLKSSEWLLTQREFADSESAQWVNGNAIYPTDSGYEGWTLRECG